MLKKGILLMMLKARKMLENSLNIEILVDNKGTIIKLKDLMPYSYS